MGFSIRHRILALWNGQLPLARVFWLYAIVYGSVANLLATILSLAVLSAGAAGAVAAAIHILPLPYNVVASVGVWRSAGSYRGSPFWAAMARGVVLIWAVLATLV